MTAPGPRVTICASMTARQIQAWGPTVVDVLRAAAEASPEVEAYVEIDDAGVPGASRPGTVGTDGRRRLTLAQWDTAADGVAALLADCGVGRGDVVCLVMPSSIDYAVCYQGALRLGAITTGVNARLGPREKASIFSRARPTVTVVDDALMNDGEQASGLPLVNAAGHVVMRSALSEAADRRSPPPVHLHDDEPVAIVWTSGSTGVPKGAVFDHRNLAAVAAGTDILSQRGDRRLSPLPFAHVAYMTRLWDEIANGVTTVITPQPWTAPGAISLLEEERVTVGQGVPTQWALVLAHLERSSSPVTFDHLRIAATGASRVPPELVRAMRARLGCPVVVRYTSTETSLGTGTRPEDPDDVVATTVGRPVTGVELDIVADASSGDGDAPGTPAAVGRVRLRSSATMRGYVGDGADGRLIDTTATAAVVDADGWVTTGDLGFIGPDGNLRLVGRVAEMYIRGGYNVYPAEVEAVLGAHPDIADVAVVGVADPVLGEIGAAFAVRAPSARAAGSAPTSLGAATPAELAELRQWCASRLADYKAPDRLYWIEALPLTAMSKVDRRVLIAMEGLHP